MTHPLSREIWQVLRAILRAGSKGTEGWRLRLNPSRRNKDGSFLTELVSAGLLEDVGPCKPPALDEQVTEAVHEPGPFHRRYRLTELGKHAAEYGEYEGPSSNEKPLPTPEEFAATRRAEWVAKNSPSSL
jgi:hypothetical protein